MHARLKLELLNAATDASVVQLLVLSGVDLLKTSLQAERTLLELTELLVAHCHVVKQLKRDHLVPSTFANIYDIKHTVGLL